MGLPTRQDGVENRDKGLYLNNTGQKDSREVLEMTFRFGCLSLNLSLLPLGNSR